MLKDFYEAVKKRIRVDHMLGHHERGNFIRSFNGGNGDYLDIFRDAPNSYIIYFSSLIPENRWIHRDVPLRLVVSAIKSFDGMTDMFGQPFHNKETHEFCY